MKEDKPYTTTEIILVILCIAYVGIVLAETAIK
jgi:hypothetical protein